MLHTQSKKAGWWENPTFETPLVKIALIHSEIAEADVDRAVFDKHLPQYKERYVELVDVFIRAADLLGHIGQKTPPRGWQMPVAANCSWFVNLLLLHKTTAKATEGYRKSNLISVSAALHSVMSLCAQIVNNLGIDFYQIVDEKAVYNSQRADHKPENRTKAGGKKL